MGDAKIGGWQSAPVSVRYGLEKDLWGENKMSNSALPPIIIAVVCVIVRSCNLIGPGL